jgi:hypothetical protein
MKEPTRVAGRIALPAPTPPDMRVRIRRLTQARSAANRCPSRYVAHRALSRIARCVVNTGCTTFLCLVVCITFGSACSPSSSFSIVPPRDTEQTNEIRSKIGIRPIKKQWVFYGREFQADKWKDGTNLCKMVQRDRSGALLWEQDYYYSGASFPTTKGTEWEFLSVNYDYIAKQASLDYVGTNVAIAILFRNLTLAPFGPRDQSGQHTQSHVGSNDHETFAVADEVLATWSKPRL